jgi:hypothetical protein
VFFALAMAVNATHCAKIRYSDQIGVVLNKSVFVFGVPSRSVKIRPLIINYLHFFSLFLIVLLRSRGYYFLFQDKTALICARARSVLLSAQMTHAPTRFKIARRMADRDEARSEKQIANHLPVCLQK